MIDGGWPYVLAAYAVAGAALFVLAAIVLASARRWSREAKKLERP